MGGAGARRPGVGLSAARSVRGAPGPHRQPGARTAPVRVNLIAAGFVDTPLSASLLGESWKSARRTAARLCSPSGASSLPPTSPPSPSTS